MKMHLSTQKSLGLTTCAAFSFYWDSFIFG